MSNLLTTQPQSILNIRVVENTICRHVVIAYKINVPLDKYKHFYA